MAYWWLLERKSFKDEPIKLTPTMGEKVQFIWLDPNNNSKIYLPNLKIAIDQSDIKAVEPSTIPMPTDDMYKLASGLDLDTKPYGKGKPLFAPDFQLHGVTYPGGVLCNWYKKNIDKREWDSYFAKTEWYLRLDDPDGGCWVAALLPEEGNSDKPNYLVRCNVAEDKHLYTKMAR